MLSELKLHIRSGTSLISLETHDEERATQFVRQAADELSMPLFEWSITTGMVRTRPSAQDTSVSPNKVPLALDYIFNNRAENNMYLLKDIGPHCRDAYVQRRLRDIQSQRHLPVVLLDPEPLPNPVRRLAVPMSLKLPDAAELERVVKETFRQIRSRSLSRITANLTHADMENLLHTLRGLTCSEAARVIASVIHFDNSLNADDLPRIVEAKRNLLQATGCLESISVNFSVDEIGGLDNLKAWLKKRRGGMSSKAREFGLEAPRGILLLGVQGCGKSLCAKIVAADWKMPLLRMDPGVLYQKYIGESENRLREALNQAETMAPVVLWIDEIEKAFASAGTESADGGLSQRMFGTLLSWMQDHRSPIFIVATANRIEALPPELMRKGRFDEVFFIDLPDAAARRNIFEIHLKRRKRDPKKFALDELAAASEGFSGAEIEQAVIAALYTAFTEKVELNDKHVLDEIRATRPLSILMQERIVELRSWAQGRCVLAD